MAEGAALLDRLTSGLEAGPSRSPVVSSSPSDLIETPDRTCCCSLQGRRKQIFSLASTFMETKHEDYEKEMPCLLLRRLIVI